MGRAAWFLLNYQFDEAVGPPAYPTFPDSIPLNPCVPMTPIQRGSRPFLRAFCVLFSALVLASGFNPRSTRAQEEPTPSPQELEQEVESTFAQSCALSGCHTAPAPQQGMNLSAGQFYASTVGEASRGRPELQRVHPGQPDSSYLVHKIEGRSSIQGQRMPLGAEPLSEEEISTIKEWIRTLEAVDEERKAAAEREGPKFPFTGWRVLNLPTTRALDAGSQLFLISHRFNPTVNQGYDALYGLDGSSIIKLGFGHAFTDRLRVMLSRSNASDDVELGTHYQIAQQGGERGWPLGMSVHGTLNWITEDPGGDEDRLRSEAFKFTGQVSLARALGDRFGVLAVPGILVNPAEDVDDEEVLVTLGLGARGQVHGNISLFAEWVPILSGYVETRTFGNFNRFDSWGGGVELNTGGHVFQVVLSNSVGMATDQYLRGGDQDIDDFFDGDFRLGFNIYRVLNF